MHIETGIANARRFIAMVDRLSREGRVIVVYADSRKYHQRWPWMANLAWQNVVLDGLSNINVRHAQFHPGDNVDGLCFSAISVAAVNRIEGLSLNSTLDDVVPPKTWWQKLRWLTVAMFTGAPI
jgi:hypothetical protein